MITAAECRAIALEAGGPLETRTALADAADAIEELTERIVAEERAHLEEVRELRETAVKADEWRRQYLVAKAQRVPPLIDSTAIRRPPWALEAAVAGAVIGFVLFAPRSWLIAATVTAVALCAAAAIAYRLRPTDQRTDEQRRLDGLGRAAARSQHPSNQEGPTP